MRNQLDAAAIPPGGLINVRDGDPGDPETLLSPTLYYYEHRAEIDVIVDADTSPDVDATFDACKLAIGQAIDADRTLGGLVDYASGEPSVFQAEPIENAPGWKAGTIAVVLQYDTPDPLS